MQTHPVIGAQTLGQLESALDDAIAATKAAMMRSLDEITFARIREVIGAARLDEEIAAAHLLAFVNWTMIPQMTAIFQALTDEVLPRLPANPGRVFFFDLADPEKRSVDDLRGRPGVVPAVRGEPEALERRTLDLVVVPPDRRAVVAEDPVLLGDALGTLELRGHLVLLEVGLRDRHAETELL